MDEEVTLPAIVDISSSTLAKLTMAIGVPRDVLASDDEIRRVWEQLPRLITQIPVEGRSALHARMCVAVHSGLFDAAINYAWNSAIVTLRGKVRSFGLHIVPQIIERDFDESILLDLKDAELIQLCLSLNLISEDAYFFLDQCRDVRNNFSAAHPAMGPLDDAEFIVFLTRCTKYALSATSNPKGVDASALIESVKGPRHTEEQTIEWFDRIDATHEAQQELIINMLHGIYCNPSSSQDTRSNALVFVRHLSPNFHLVPNLHLSAGTQTTLQMGKRIGRSYHKISLKIWGYLHFCLSKNVISSFLKVARDFSPYTKNGLISITSRRSQNACWKYQIKLLFQLLLRQSS